MMMNCIPYFKLNSPCFDFLWGAWHEKGMLLSQFDGIVYINLARRLDRKQALLEMLASLEVDMRKVHRIEAVDDPLNGRRGCLVSHLKALDKVREEKWERGLILEDDVIYHCAPQKIEEETKRFFEKFQGVWDVYVLGGAYFEVYHTFEKEVYRIKNSDRAHAYVVHPHYFPSFRECLQKGADQVKDHLFYQQSERYAVDALWKVLQQNDRWFGPKDRLFHQKEGLSDIEHITKLLRH